MSLSSGVDADAAERPSDPGDRHHRQGDGEEIWQILQEDDLIVSTEGPREKVQAPHLRHKLLKQINSPFFFLKQTKTTSNTCGDRKWSYMELRCLAENACC